MKLNEGDNRTEFACLCCLHSKWLKHPGQAFICPYRAEDKYCTPIEEVYKRESKPETSWIEIGKRLAKELKKE